MFTNTNGPFDYILYCQPVPALPPDFRLITLGRINQIEFDLMSKELLQGGLGQTPQMDPTAHFQSGPSPMNHLGKDPRFPRDPFEHAYNNQHIHDNFKQEQFPLYGQNQNMKENKEWGSDNLSIGKKAQQNFGQGSQMGGPVGGMPPIPPNQIAQASPFGGHPKHHSLSHTNMRLASTDTVRSNQGHSHLLPPPPIHNTLYNNKSTSRSLSLSLSRPNLYPEQPHQIQNIKNATNTGFAGMVAPNQLGLKAQFQEPATEFKSHLESNSAANSKYQDQISQKCVGNNQIQQQQQVQWESRHSAFRPMKHRELEKIRDDKSTSQLAGRPNVSYNQMMRKFDPEGYQMQKTRHDELGNHRARRDERILESRASNSQDAILRPKVRRSPEHFNQVDQKEQAEQRYRRSRLDSFGQEHPHLHNMFTEHKMHHNAPQIKQQFGPYQQSNNDPSTAQLLHSKSQFPLNQPFAATPKKLNDQIPTSAVAHPTISSPSQIIHDSAASKAGKSLSENNSWERYNDNKSTPVLGYRVSRDLNQMQQESVGQNNSDSKIQEFNYSDKTEGKLKQMNEVIDKIQEKLSENSKIFKNLLEHQQPWPIQSVTRIRYLAILNIIQIFNRYWSNTNFIQGLKPKRVEVYELQHSGAVGHFQYCNLQAQNNSNVFESFQNNQILKKDESQLQIQQTNPALKKKPDPKMSLLQKDDKPTTTTADKKTAPFPQDIQMEEHNKREDRAGSFECRSLQAGDTGRCIKQNANSLLKPPVNHVSHNYDRKFESQNQVQIPTNQFHDVPERVSQRQSQNNLQMMFGDDINNPEACQHFNQKASTLHMPHSQESSEPEQPKLWKKVSHIANHHHHQVHTDKKGNKCTQKQVQKAQKDLQNDYQISREYKQICENLTHKCRYRRDSISITQSESLNQMDIYQLQPMQSNQQQNGDVDHQLAKNGSLKQITPRSREISPKATGKSLNDQNSATSQQNKIEMAETNQIRADKSRSRSKIRSEKSDKDMQPHRDAVRDEYVQLYVQDHDIIVVSSEERAKVGKVEKRAQDLNAGRDEAQGELQINDINQSVLSGPKSEIIIDAANHQMLQNQDEGKENMVEFKNADSLVSVPKNQQTERSQQPLVMEYKQEDQDTQLIQYHDMHINIDQVENQNTNKGTNPTSKRTNSKGNQKKQEKVLTKDGQKINSSENQPAKPPKYVTIQKHETHAKLAIVHYDETRVNFYRQMETQRLSRQERMKNRQLIREQHQNELFLQKMQIEQIQDVENEVLTGLDEDSFEKMAQIKELISKQESQLMPLPKAKSNPAKKNKNVEVKQTVLVGQKRDALSRGDEEDGHDRESLSQAQLSVRSEENVSQKSTSEKIQKKRNRIRQISDQDLPSISDKKDINLSQNQQNTPKRGRKPKKKKVSALKNDTNICEEMPKTDSLKKQKIGGDCSQNLIEAIQDQPKKINENDDVKDNIVGQNVDGKANQEDESGQIEQQIQEKGPIEEKEITQSKTITHQIEKVIEIVKQSSQQHSQHLSQSDKLSQKTDKFAEFKQQFWLRADMRQRQSTFQVFEKFQSKKMAEKYPSTIGYRIDLMVSHQWDSMSFDEKESWRQIHQDLMKQAKINAEKEKKKQAKIDKKNSQKAQEVTDEQEKRDCQKISELDPKPIEAEVTQVPSNKEDNQPQKINTHESNHLLEDDEWYTIMMNKIKGDHQAEQDQMNNILSIVNKPQNEYYPDLETVDIFRTFKVTTRDPIPNLDHLKQSQNLQLWHKPIYNVYQQFKEYDDQEKAYEYELLFDEKKLENPKLTWAQFEKKNKLDFRQTVRPTDHWRVFGRAGHYDKRPHLVVLNDEYYNLYPDQNDIE